MNITKKTDCTIRLDQGDIVNVVQVDGSVTENDKLGYIERRTHKTDPEYVCHDLKIGSGAEVHSATVICNGAIEVLSGGILHNVTVASGGMIWIDGGTATNILEAGGSVDAAEWNSATIAEFQPSVYQNNVISLTCMSVHSGTVLRNNTITEHGSIVVCSGGYMERCTLTGGSIASVKPGGICDGLVVMSGCRLFCRGGNISNVTVFDGGILALEPVMNEDDSWYDPLDHTSNIIVSSGGIVDMFRHSTEPPMSVKNLTLMDGAIVLDCVEDEETDTQTELRQYASGGRLYREGWQEEFDRNKEFMSPEEEEFFRTHPQYVPDPNMNCKG